jgi:hypothetical protein
MPGDAVGHIGGAPAGICRTQQATDSIPEPNWRIIVYENRQA